MDPIQNPYAPGAGTPPPELAGRSEVIEASRVALKRIAAHRSAQSIILVGLRGVGKTVLLNKMNDTAIESGFRSAFVEAHEGKTLPELLIPSLRTILYSLSTIESAKEKSRKALRVLKSFLNGMKVSIGDVDIALSIDPEIGSADSGDIESDLPTLIEALAEAAESAKRPVSLFIDELQYLHPQEFSALIMSIHKINQRSLPLIMIGAGLPQIHGLAGNSKSYAERLFRFLEIGALSDDDALAAVANPAKEEDVVFSQAAISKILDRTKKYPYFLQQWAYECWNTAKSSPINEQDVDSATVLAIEELDRSFFKVRFDRCTPSEKRYMRALAELGQGRHRSGDVAESLGIKVTSAAPVRNALIQKGMIYSPAHGDTEFTVPLFDQYMRRVMPELEKRKS